MTATAHPRITARIDANTQSLLNQAARILGIPTINAFVVAAAVEKAKAVIKEDEAVEFNAEQTRLLLNALERPPEPNEALRKLFAKYQEDN